MGPSEGGVNSDWWDYRGNAEPVPFGDHVTYELGMEWLDGHGGTVADWGCGLAYGKRYVTESAYWGVDGSVNNPFADEVADLREYRKPADCIFMRHVLEHNYEWAAILDNAVASFRRRFALVIFTPWAGETKPWNPAHLTLDIHFRKADLEGRFGGFLAGEDSVDSDTQYGHEHLFYLEKPGA